MGVLVEVLEMVNEGLVLSGNTERSFGFLILIVKSCQNNEILKKSFENGKNPDFSLTLIKRNFKSL